MLLARITGLVIAKSRGQARALFVKENRDASLEFKDKMSITKICSIEEEPKVVRYGELFDKLWPLVLESMKWDDNSMCHEWDGGFWRVWISGEETELDTLAEYQFCPECGMRLEKGGKVTDIPSYASKYLLLKEEETNGDIECIGGRWWSRFGNFESLDDLAEAINENKN